MAILVQNIPVPLGEDPATACQRALRRLGLKPAQLAESHLAKVSLDARRRDRVRYVCSAELALRDPALEERLAAREQGVRLVRETPPAFAPAGAPLDRRPVVVGLGPAGMFCALALAREGYRPLVLERGAPVERRVAAVERFWRTGELDPACNVQFGEGGAGTFSDGKLTTRIGDERCGWVLRQLAAFGAPEEILHRAKPHIGTDRLRQVVRRVREEILRLGGEIRFDTRLEGIEIAGGRVVSCTAGGENIPCSRLVLAVGHSARDTFELLFDKGLPVEAKPFSVGVRVEHLQREIDRGLYGDLAGDPHLPVGEYQLSRRVDGQGVYTFCMCPGGTVVPAASEEGGVVVNGMSEYARSGPNANCALVAGVDSRDFGQDPRAGVDFQRQLERAAFALGGGGYRAPCQSADAFLAGRPGANFGRVAPSYALGVTPADFSRLFPPRVYGMLQLGLRDFGRKLPGFDAADTLLTGVETRTSSPVRVLRGEDLCSPAAFGLYPCGEGAGYAGGIVSAAVDGVRVAQAIMGSGRPPR